MIARGEIKTPEKAVKRAIRPPAPGVIERDVVYTRDEFLRRVGWAKLALRSARKAGLRTIEFNRRTYVRGADFFEFLEAQMRDR
jgi:hypothetical protein